jgi:hypoxanthine phosphoribosyltransferase
VSLRYTDIFLHASVMQCPDNFVVGYGMDFDEFYRNLPYIGVLKPEYYS